MNSRSSAYLILTMVSATLVTLPPEVSADERLARRIGCTDCHAVVQKGVGPAYSDIAARYRGNADAGEALVRIVKNGGKGNWTAATGGVAMPPYSALLADAEVRLLVEWVLSQ